MSRPALILLPGLLCDRSVWAAQVEALGATFECIVPSYGEIDSIPGMARSVLAQAPERFLLAGHSMGGRVALEVLRAAPQRVRRLVLMDTGFRARAPGEAGNAEERQRRRLVEMGYREGMRAMGREWLAGMVHPDRLGDTALVESILAMIERFPPETHEAQIRALLARPEAADVLATIACPTLLVCGRQDAWSPLSRHEEMQGLIPGSRLSVVENSGHMSTMEQAPQVNALLREWMD